MIRYAKNTGRRDIRAPQYAPDATAPVRRLHAMAPGYAPTPLVALAQPGVRAVYVKDESSRFGLKAFKGLGSIYAMFRMICRELGLNPAETTLDDLRQPPCAQRVRRMTFATTTDGNHGKGVSWAAGLFGCPSRVFMPRGTVEVRAQAIRDAGSAQVTITDMRYDDCVAWTRDEAWRNGWHLIQDTSWPGYEEVPGWIMQGYTTLLCEAVRQMPLRPTHIFLQAGVGAMAGAIAGAALETWTDCPPTIVTVEPAEVACFYDSFAAGDGKPHAAVGSGQTEMAGLNCAVPCTLAWDILGACAAGGIACDDAITERGMRLLAKASVVAGESGAVTAGLVNALATDPVYGEIASALGLDGDSVVFLINTEGDTDPENYRRILASGDCRTGE